MRASMPAAAGLLNAVSSGAARPLEEGAGYRRDMVDEKDVTRISPGQTVDRAAIFAAAEALAEAIVANDAERISALLAEDWAIVSETGVGTKHDFLGLVASGDLTHSAMERAGEPRIQLLGDVALYTARITNTAHYLGQRYDADEWTTDVFVRREDRWICMHSHITPAAPHQDPENT